MRFGANRYLSDLMVWVVMGVAGWLGYTTWDMSGNVRELATEIKHINANNQQYSTDISAIRSTVAKHSVEIERLRNSQVGYASGE